MGSGSVLFGRTIMNRNRRLIEFFVFACCVFFIYLIVTKSTQSAKADIKERTVTAIQMLEQCRNFPHVQQVIMVLHKTSAGPNNTCRAIKFDESNGEEIVIGYGQGDTIDESVTNLYNNLYNLNPLE